MKKIIGLFTLSIAFAAMSCTSKPAEPTKEVIVVPATPAPAPTTVIQTTPPAEKPTKIVLNKSGAKVETKKVDITVNKPQ